MALVCVLSSYGAINVTVKCIITFWPTVHYTTLYNLTHTILIIQYLTHQDLTCSSKYSYCLKAVCFDVGLADSIKVDRHTWHGVGLLLCVCAGVLSGRSYTIGALKLNVRSLGGIGHHLFGGSLWYMRAVQRGSKQWLVSTFPRETLRQARWVFYSDPGSAMEQWGRKGINVGFAVAELL